MKVTEPVGLQDSATVVPLAGAGAFKLIVPVMLRPKPTVVEPKLTVIEGAVTDTVALIDAYPEAVARIDVLPTASGVTVTFALATPAGMVTVEGTEMILESNPLRLTIVDPELVGFKVTVSVPGELYRARTLGARVIWALPATTVTVEGLLVEYGSETINCAM